MQPVPTKRQCFREAEHSCVVPSPAQQLHSGSRHSPTWAVLPHHHSRFLAEGPWPAAAVAQDRSYPGYNYEGSSGPVSEQSLDPESVVERTKPSSPECLSFVLGVAFAGLLLGIGLLVVHNSLSPYDMTPNLEEDALERRLEVAPNSGGQRLVPRRVVNPDVDERGNRRSTTRTRTRVQAASRMTVGGTARPPLKSANTSPETAPRDTAVGTGGITDESCSRHVYTYCAHPRPEFYYSADRRACVAAAADTVHVCNRGSNRFSSMESCLASCVNGRLVSDRCYESTLFFPCAQ
ncbi:hypothetical protein HPB50_029404 [Hyalomma asiaticum]|nr:hypothetical protein HPB50_029404 [Hyalomma asiaticum]